MRDALSVFRACNCPDVLQKKAFPKENQHLQVWKHCARGIHKCLASKMQVSESNTSFKNFCLKPLLSTAKHETARCCSALMADNNHQIPDGRNGAYM
jgi:hypothetical protein